MDLNQHNIVTLLNIDDEDFEFEYSRSTGNPPYVMLQGKPSRYPAFIAEHALKHFIDKILTKRGIKTNNEEERKKLASQIVIGEESFQQGQRQLTEDEKVRRQVEELNKPTELENVLKSYKERTKVAEPQKVDDSQVLDLTEEAEEKLKTEKEKTEAVKPALPSREELVKYAEQVHKITINRNLLDRWEKMSVAKLAKELDHPAVREENA